MGLLRRKTAAGLVPWVIVLLASLAMLPGDSSLVARGLRSLIPYMSFSRFPPSDYRAPLVLALLVLAAASLRDFMAGRADRFLRVRYLWLPFTIGFFLVTGQAGWQLPTRELVRLLVILGATLLVLWLARLQASKAHALGLAGLLTLVLAAGRLAVWSSAETWQVSGTKEWYRKGIGFSPIGPLPIARLFTQNPSARPAREDPGDPTNFAWRGYLLGSYQMRDYGTQFVAQEQVLREPTLRAWMSKPWEARRVAEEVPPEPVAATG